jgi:hypothetical protein
VGDREVIAPEDCLRVTEYLLQQCRGTGCPLDLRLQQKAFATYRQHQADCSVNHWEDLIAISVREATSHFKHEQDTTTAEERKARRRNIVRELMGMQIDVAEQERIYEQRTDKSRSDFYRRKAEVVSGEFGPAD